MAGADFWNNPDAAQKVVAELKTVKSVVESYRGLHTELEDEIGLLDISDDVKDADHIKEVAAKLPDLERRVEATEVQALFTGPNDTRDVFVSIHANSSPLRGTHGIETYLLSEASSSRALEIAARENDVTVAEMTDLQKILYDLMLRSKVNESRDLAEDVHRSLLAQLGRRYSGVNDLGVKRGPFYVLLGAQMPGILVEVGFITNPADAKRSLQGAFRQAIAEGIAEGVVRFVGGAARTARTGPVGPKGEARPPRPPAR